MFYAGACMAAFHHGGTSPGLASQASTSQWPIESRSLREKWSIRRQTIVWTKFQRLPRLPFSGRRPFESAVPHGRDRRARQQRAASRPARPLRSISVFQLFICLSAFAFPLFPSNLTNNLGCAVSGQGAFAHCSGARLCEPQRVDGNGRSRLVPTLKWLATRCGWSGRTQPRSGNCEFSRSKSECPQYLYFWFFLGVSRFGG